jgi:hypothetical protein
LFSSIRSNEGGFVGEEKRELVPLEGVPSARAASGSPAPLAATELAAQIVNVMDMIAERMELESPHPSTASRVRGGRTVPRQFVLALAAAVESMPELQAFGTFDAAEAREVLQASDAYRQVAERTARLASMNYTIEARWSRVAAAAMLTFSVASIRARHPEEAKLAACVERLGKLLGRRGKKAKKEGGEGRG